MSKREITCPHKLPITQCEEHWKMFREMTGQTDIQSDAKLKKKIRQVFNYRIHRTDEKITVITKDPEVRKYKTIIAPYEPTLEKIEKLIQADRQNLLQQVRDALPKERAFEGDYNQALKEVHDILNKIGEQS